jgi:hypothetical protein
MEFIILCARVHETEEQTMQRFLACLTYNIRCIVRHHHYFDMTDLLHQAREAELTLAEDAKFGPRSIARRGCFPPRTDPSVPTSSGTSGFHGNASSKPDSVISNAKKTSQPAASGTGSSNSTARNRDMNCHTCGGKGHFRRDCPNKKVMLINEETEEYETGDDADPNSDEEDDDMLYGDASSLPTIVCSPKVLSVSPDSTELQCNLFQKAVVGPGKACKVIIDGGSCGNLASKELCTKMKLKYIPHPNPYFIQWLSDNGEMKISHMVRVEFQI